jgi:hypothetical protein
VRHIDGALPDTYRDNFPSGSAPLPERALAMLRDDVQGGERWCRLAEHFFTRTRWNRTFRLVRPG